MRTSKSGQIDGGYDSLIDCHASAYDLIRFNQCRLDQAILFPPKNWCPRPEAWGALFVAADGSLDVRTDQREGSICVEETDVAEGGDGVRYDDLVKDWAGSHHLVNGLMKDARVC